MPSPINTYHIRSFALVSLPSLPLHAWPKLLLKPKLSFLSGVRPQRNPYFSHIHHSFGANVGQEIAPDFLAGRNPDLSPLSALDAIRDLKYQTRLLVKLVSEVVSLVFQPALWAVELDESPLSLHVNLRCLGREIMAVSFQLHIHSTSFRLMNILL